MLDTSKSKPLSIPCPCCAHQIQAPTLEQVVYHYKIAPQAARILGAVWAGRGLPVSTQRIFDAMWADDINGGPPEARMYNNFKWSMNDLRNRLRGSGIGVESAGYNAGYKLVIGQAERRAA